MAGFAYRARAKEKNVTAEPSRRAALLAFALTTTLTAAAAPAPASEPVNVRTSRAPRPTCTSAS